MLVKCIVYSELIIGLRAVSIYMCFDIISIELMFLRLYSIILF